VKEDVGAGVVLGSSNICRRGLGDGDGLQLALQALLMRRSVGVSAIEEVCMPTAKTPQHTSQLLAETVTSGDIDAVLSLYAPDGTFALPRAFGEGSVTGTDALREALSGFLALSPELAVNPERTLVSGDTALVIGNWTLKGRDAEGNDVEAGGRYADVVRRQPDGTWLVVIDNPNGSD
jgi:ketosteroid isomerase-like protein